MCIPAMFVSIAYGRDMVISNILDYEAGLMQAEHRPRFLQIRLRHESRDKYVIHISKTAFQKKCYFKTPHYYVSIMRQQKKSRG